MLYRPIFRWATGLVLKLDLAKCRKVCRLKEYLHD
jgi:hypothetical protein